MPLTLRSPAIAVVSDDALDPGSRALLELTLRQGVSDDEIARILGADSGEIADRREAAVEAVIEADEAPEAESVVAVAERILAEARAAREESDTRDVAERPRGSAVDLFLRFAAAAYLVLLLVAVVVYKGAFIEMLTMDPLLTAYGLIVCGYIITRFIFSVLYRRPRHADLEPRVAIVMPAFNEEDAIGR